MGILRRKLFILPFLLAFLGAGLYEYRSWSLRRGTLSKEERLWMDPFFRHIMLEKSSIYTLLGSKPLTSFVLFYPKNREDNQPTLEELWDKWETIKNRYPISKKFLFVKKKWNGDWKTYFPEYEVCYEIYFINVLQTAFVIQENYEIFKQVIGCDFDPLQLVVEFEKDPYGFWEKIVSSEYCHLWGLLYGFGKQNAYSFFWKNRHRIGLASSTEEALLSPYIDKKFSREEQGFFGKITNWLVFNFPIPIFASFSQDDPVIKKYIAEKREIKRLYKGKDFLNFTLKLLTEERERDSHL